MDSGCRWTRGRCVTCRACAEPAEPPRLPPRFFWQRLQACLPDAAHGVV